MKCFGIFLNPLESLKNVIDEVEEDFYGVVGCVEFSGRSRCVGI